MRPSLPLGVLPFPSFKKHRSNGGRPQSTLDLSLLTTPPPPLWASLPTPPMSASTPPEERLDPPQLAGRRRKRSDTPPAASAPAPSSPEEEILARTTRTGDVSRSNLVYAAAGPAVPPFVAPFPPAQLHGYGSGSSRPAQRSATFQPPPGTGEGERATRKTKAHVASACVNCKKKHLRCDSSRPCRRCVQSGKESSCVDVEHKKRGRPPLKAEDASTRRSLESAMSPPQGGPGYRPPSAEFSTYAQPQRPGEMRPPVAGGLAPYPRPVAPRLVQPLQSVYATPSVAPSVATATGIMSRSPRDSLPGIGVQPQAPYLGGPSRGQRSLAPDITSQYGQSFSYDSRQQPQLAPVPSPGLPPGPFSLFPRGDPPQPQPPVSSRPSYGQSIPPELLLPPILPAPPGTAVDPAMAQQRRQQEQQQMQPSGSPQGDNGTTRQPDPKRPKISDILRDD